MKNDHKERRDREKIEQVGQSRLILNSDHGGAKEKGTFYPIQIWPQKGRNSFSFFSASLAGLKKEQEKLAWDGESGISLEKKIMKSQIPNPNPQTHFSLMRLGQCWLFTPQSNLAIVWERKPHQRDPMFCFF